jgi:hypothetical protein
MQFLFPSFLFALAATAVPVLIHLFNFRRTKRVLFTNVAFLRQVNTTTSRFRKLKHWLVLVARVAAIACLVLAFAQPVIPARSGAGFGGRGVTSLYLDNSLSMQGELDNKRALDVAVAKAEDLLTVFPNATTLQLLTNDFGAGEHGLATPGQVRDRLAAVDFASTPRALESVYRRQRALAAAHSSGSGDQLFWFSDFQKSTTGDLNRLRLDSTTRLFLVPVQAPNRQNVLVDSVWLGTPFVRDMQPNRLSVTLRNTGNDAVENLSVKLLIDDKQVAAQPVTVPARGAVTVPFPFTLRGRGYQRGRITFDDSPVTFDNDYFFVLNAAPTIPVLHLFGQKAPGGYVEAVFANDSLFALRSLSVANADPGLLRAVNLVVLEGVSRVEGALRSSLDAFVRNGGSVLVIPPSQPDAAAFGSLLGGYGIRLATGPVPSPNPPQALAEAARNSPFYADLFENTTQRDPIAMPSAAPVLTWQVPGEKLLQFRDGRPFLTQSRVGQGTVYLLASPLDPAFGDFARNALFVPILYKMAALSVRQEPLAYSFRDAALNLDVPGATPNAVFRLRRGKLDLIPVQRLVGNRLTLELPKTDQLNAGQTLESGYYELLLNDRPQRLLAFNHDDAESQLDVYTPGELRQIFAGKKNVQVFDNRTDGDFVKAFREQNLGVSLWKYFLLAALGFLLVEVGLIRWMKG